MKQYIISIFVVAMLFTGCENLFSPAVENNRDLDAMYKDNTFAQGILLNGYIRMPSNNWTFSDAATDNAVMNDRSNSFLRIATGQWSSNNNPLEQWANSKAAIHYLNIFLAGSGKVVWAKDEMVNRMFIDRLNGEAYGLRALFMFHLLQAHGGWSSSGELLGVPIILEPETTASDFTTPRATFEACMKQIYSDLDKAEELLPLDYNAISSDAQIPAKYAGVTKEQYNRVFDDYVRGRLTARIAKGIRAKVALLAASPAFNPSEKQPLWADAANAAGEVIKLAGGLATFDATGHTWYSNSSINDMKEGANPNEILWRTSVGNSRSLEQDHCPPSIYGNGRMNPTQNLVDAFPMLDGYPISEPLSGYDPQNPYANRDPRLQTYIVVNGSTAGPNNSVINTAADGTTNDALGKTEYSTRTGYYMRKLLRKEVNLNPSNPNDQKHYNPHIRYTEIYLIYAEAANEAWGPLVDNGFGFSAYDVIKKIRNRAGIGTSNGDAYLESIKGDKVKMRELIRNERRLELCFEGFRFWDLRRWNDGNIDLTEVARGVSIRNNTYNDINVENRVYAPYMNFGPIPYSEVLKWKLVQNKGW